MRIALAFGPFAFVALGHAALAAQDLEWQVMQVFERAGPGVVNITSRSISYDFFLRPIPQEGSGSGFVYDAAGHIVTNFHVIEGARELHVTFYDETRVSASVVGFDPSNDLAVIQVDVASEVLNVIPIRASDELRVGRFVVAIGATLSASSKRSPRAWSARSGGSFKVPMAGSSGRSSKRTPRSIRGTRAVRSWTCRAMWSG